MVCSRSNMSQGKLIPSFFVREKRLFNLTISLHHPCPIAKWLRTSTRRKNFFYAIIFTDHLQSHILNASEEPSANMVLLGDAYVVHSLLLLLVNSKVKVSFKDCNTSRMHDWAFQLPPMRPKCQGLGLQTVSCGEKTISSAQTSFSSMGQCGCPSPSVIFCLHHIRCAQFC